MAEIAVVISEPSTQVRVHVNDEVVLRFDENPTTGFVWLAKGNVPPSLVPKSTDFKPGGLAPGAGGRREFSYVCYSRGISELRFELARPWQPDQPLKVSLVNIQCD